MTHIKLLSASKYDYKLLFCRDIRLIDYSKGD